MPGSQTFDQSQKDAARMLQTICQFLSDMHRDSVQFRDFCTTSLFLHEMLHILFPVVCSSDTVSAETELNSKNSALTFDGGDVVIQSVSAPRGVAPPIVRTITVDSSPPQTTTATESNSRRAPLRRGSSFVLITSETSAYSPSAARLSPAITSPVNGKINHNEVGITDTVVEGLLEIVVAVFVDMVLIRRDFNGFGLITKVCMVSCLGDM